MPRSTRTTDETSSSQRPVKVYGAQHMKHPSLQTVVSLSIHGTDALSPLLLLETTWSKEDDKAVSSSMVNTVHSTLVNHLRSTLLRNAKFTSEGFTHSDMERFLAGTLRPAADPVLLERVVDLQSHAKNEVYNAPLGVPWLIWKDQAFRLKEEFQPRRQMKCNLDLPGDCPPFRLDSRADLISSDELVSVTPVPSSSSATNDG